MVRGEEKEGNQNKSEIIIILVFIEPDSVPGPRAKHFTGINSLNPHINAEEWDRYCYCTYLQMRKARLGEVKVSEGSWEDDRVRQGRDFYPWLSRASATAACPLFPSRGQDGGQGAPGAPDLRHLSPQKLHAANVAIGPLFGVEMKWDHIYKNTWHAQ